jgi:hypothetical protein
LTNEVKELRSEFVDKRSELMKLKMESTVSEKMEVRKIFPSSVTTAAAVSSQLVSIPRIFIDFNYQ